MSNDAVFHECYYWHAGQVLQAPLIDYFKVVEFVIHDAANIPYNM